MYFAVKNMLNVGLEYAQICFLACLVVSLDSIDSRTQYCWLIVSSLVSIYWGSLSVRAGLIMYIPGSEFIFVTALSLVPFFAGMIYCCYVCTKAPASFRKVEIDLLLYLVALSAMCFFTQNHFNNNLHMILDIRTMVLLFNGMYMPKDKMDLLRNIPFVVIMALTMIAFFIYGVGGSWSSITFGLIYVVIGGILLYIAHLKNGEQSVAVAEGFSVSPIAENQNSLK